MLEKLYLAWGVKEAYVKALGVGIGVEGELRSIEVDFDSCYCQGKLEFEGLKVNGVKEGTRFKVIELDDSGDIAVVCGIGGGGWELERRVVGWDDWQAHLNGE